MLANRRASRIPLLLLLTAAISSACSETESTAPQLLPIDMQGAAGGNGGGGGMEKVKVQLKHVQLAANSLTIGGPGIGLALSLANQRQPIDDGIAVRADIIQGATTRRAFDAPSQCSTNASPGALPKGRCDMNVLVAVSNGAMGTGTLTAGGATLLLRVVRTADGVETELDRIGISIDLAGDPDLAPIITEISPASNYVIIGGATTPYTTTVVNPGATQTNITIQGWITQGVVRHPAGGTGIVCNEGTFGELPAGNCVAPGDMVALADAESSEPLVPGAATFELELKQFDGTVLDTESIPIVLVANTPSIVSVDLSSTSIAVGNSTQYTVTLYNPTGGELLEMGIQGYITQGIASRAAGGTTTTCSALGTMPVGACTFSFSVIASNTTDGTGTLVPGPATFRVELKQGSVVLDTKVVAVVLTGS